MELREVCGPKDAGVPVVYVVDMPEHPLPFGMVPADVPLRVVSAPVADWGHCLTPWPAPALYRGEADYAGAADETLAELRAAATAFEAARGLAPSARAVAGYSLGGLFALWALASCDAFVAAASMSGSLWYDDWCGWLATRPFAEGQRFAYLSLGTKERRASRPRLKQVADATEQTAGILREKGLSVELVYGPGGHIDHQPERVAAALSALARMLVPS